jgi:hypothetical protein
MQKNDELARFQGSRATYIREHLILAALGSVVASGVLMWMGNPHPWTGVVGAVLAIAARGIYVADEQLGFVWTLTKTTLSRPDGFDIPVRDIDRVRVIFSAAQVITRSGDKHLIKYQADPAETKSVIEAAL